MKKHSIRLLILGNLMSLLGLSTVGQAQIIPGQADTQINQSGSQININGGVRSQDGTNLFHQFQQFGISPAQTANIQSNPAIRNIFMRVNGSNPSLIEGILQLTGGASNLFLLNPNGILFGANAKLNLPASFSATTASGVEFEQGIWTGSQSFDGVPKQFLFSPNAGAIANFANLSVPQNLSLIGSSVLNLGQLSGQNLTIASVPNSQSVKITPAGNVLSFEVQSLPASTRTLQQLLSQNNSIHHANQLETTPDGKIQLKGSNLEIPNQSGTTIINGALNAETAKVFGENISLSKLNLQVPGGLEFNADRQIWIQRDLIPTLSLEQGEKVTFRAGESFLSELILLSKGRSIEIQSPNLRSQTINTTLATQNGAVTLTGLDGQPAQQANINVIVTPNQDVTIRAQQIQSQFIATNGGNNVQGGKVTLEGQSTISVGGIVTKGQDVSLSSTNSIRTGAILTTGGNVSIQADRIDSGFIWTTPDQSNNAGNVTLTARTDLNTRRIEANANSTGTAGNVTLNNLTGDIELDSIQASGGQQGGKVEISGDRIRITGSDSLGRSITARESIRIVHRGGALNESFNIGDASFNGTAGAFQVGTTQISSGQFAIAPETITYQPTPSLTITAENTIPSFVDLPASQPFQIDVNPGSRSRFTLAELGIPLPTDPERDQIKLWIRPKPNLASSGGKLLDINGEAITSPRIISIRDRLTYIAPKQPGSLFDTFEITAIDATTFTPLAIYPSIPISFTNVVLPPIESLTPALTESNLSANRIPDASFDEVAALDSRLTEEYLAAGFKGDPHAIDAAGLARQIEGKTGIKPALVYLHTLPDRLELTVLTSRGRFRKTITVDQALLLSTIKTFRREITNPLRTHTTSYLSSSQQLYRWMIAPIRDTLKVQGVTNLVLLPDAGLRSLPYAALHDGQQFLIEQFSVGLMPSLGLTQTDYVDLRTAAALTIGISESTQDQSPLPMVKTEVTNIAQLWKKEAIYLNEQATLKNLQSARSRHNFSIVHLATHAHFSAGSPDNAYIQLWSERLKLSQIRDLDWHQPAIELLVLSACQTALGDRDSELGFAGLAIQTGVKTAIASLWSVNDVATTVLISQFYDNLNRSKIKAEALRQSQIAMLRGQTKIEDGKIIGLQSKLTLETPEDIQVSDPDFRHPYYWAAFTTIGNPW